MLVKFESKPKPGEILFTYTGEVIELVTIDNNPSYLVQILEPSIEYSKAMIVPVTEILSIMQASSRDADVIGSIIRTAKPILEGVLAFINDLEKTEMPEVK